MGKEDIKLPFFAVNKVDYIKTLKDFIHILLQLIDKHYLIFKIIKTRKFSTVAGDTNQNANIIVFLNAMNKEKKILIPFKIEANI